MRHHRTLLLIPGLALAGLATACSHGAATPTAGSAQPSGSSSTTAPASTPASGGAAPAATTAAPAKAGSGAALAVQIKDFMFTIPGNVKTGGKITVRNDDSEIHTFTLNGKNSVPVPAHSSSTLTAPTAPGTYRVTCDYHGDMHATLTVTA